MKNVKVNNSTYGNINIQDIFGGDVYSSCSPLLSFVLTDNRHRSDNTPQKNYDFIKVIPTTTPRIVGKNRNSA